MSLGDAYLDRLGALLRAIDPREIDGIVEVLAEAHQREACVFVMGNGGSAASASHWVNDLTRWRAKPFRAISLVDNAAIVTAYANDEGFEHIFRMQLQNLMTPGDVVVAISASGNSPNLVSALDYANAVGGVTIGLTGFSGGALREIADSGVHVPSAMGEYGPVEDAHMILGHLVTERLWVLFAGAEA